MIPGSGRHRSITKRIELSKLRLRQLRFKGTPDFDNSALGAGMPMYFRCDGCGNPEGIELPEDWQPPRPRFCVECQTLVNLGYLP